jgi:flagellar biosynthesis/type III secretory pathway protein FliH
MVTTSNSGVLRQPLLSTEAHVMGASEATYVDPIMASRLEGARGAGYEQGFAEGARAAEAGARRSAELALARLQAGVATVRADLAPASAALVPGLIDLAVDIAKQIVDEVPDQVRASMIARLTEAIDHLDDDDLVLVIHPGDAAEVSMATDDLPGITVRTDDRLGTGEARIESRWCRADLTLGTAWQIVESGVRD